MGGDGGGGGALAGGGAANGHGSANLDGPQPGLSFRSLGSWDGALDRALIARREQGHGQRAISRGSMLMRPNSGSHDLVRSNAGGVAWWRFWRGSSASGEHAGRRRSGRRPRSWMALNAKSKRLARDLREPLVYIFFLACFVVMIQLLPTIRSYGSREQIEEEVGALLEIGNGPPATSNGFGPSGLGTNSQPGMCPAVVYNFWENEILDPALAVSATNRAFQWLVQVGRLFHRPTQCEDCSFKDVSLYRRYAGMGSWVELATAEGQPSNVDMLTFGVKYFDALDYDFTEGGQENGNFGAGTRVNRTLLGEQTMEPDHWYGGTSYGFALGLSTKLQHLMAGRCNETGGVGAEGSDWLACEIARFQSTAWLSANDMCSPFQALNLLKGVQLMTQNEDCVGPTSADTTSSCPIDINMRVHVLVKSTPLSAAGLEAIGQQDGLWVLITYDANDDSVSYTFVPVDLYPGAQGDGELCAKRESSSMWLSSRSRDCTNAPSVASRHACAVTDIRLSAMINSLYGPTILDSRLNTNTMVPALLAFQILFVIFTVWFLWKPIGGRLYLYTIRLRSRGRSKGGILGWLKAMWDALLLAFSRMWFWLDLSTFVLMVLTIILYGVFVHRHGEIQDDLQRTSDVLLADTEGEWEHNTLRVSCCGNFTGDSDRTATEIKKSFVYSPVCCASPLGTCWSVCSDEDVVALTEWHVQGNLTPMWLAEDVYAAAFEPAVLEGWLGPSWFFPNESATVADTGGSATSDDANASSSGSDAVGTSLERSCLRPVDGNNTNPNETWCGTDNGFGCWCTPDCLEAGDCCDDVNLVCTQSANPIDWVAYEFAVALRYQMRPPRYSINPRESAVASGLIEAAGTQLVPGQLDALAWYEAKSLEYDTLAGAIENASDKEYDFVICLALVSILLFARTLKYASIDSRMSLLLLTFAYAAGSIFFFLVTFCLLFFGFVFAAQIYNGRLLIEGYTTFFLAFTNCFNLLFDAFDSSLFPPASSWVFWIWCAATRACANRRGVRARS